MTESDPTNSYDSDGNIAPLMSFHGNIMAPEAARKFAEMATPEPRIARSPQGKLFPNGNYHGTFRLVGGKRTYFLTYDAACKYWRVYMMPKNFNQDDKS